jgi:multisubunit Na+/H+ antiporter MnhB subunit
MKMRSSNPLVSWFAKSIIPICVITLALMLFISVSALPPFSNRMLTLVSEQLGNSGVENPVTAVLLNFRGYDTLLEIGVLLLAAISVFAISSPSSGQARPHTSQMAALLLRWILPLTILVGGYVLWIGSYAPGGAFQAGAILAGGGILFTTVVARQQLFANKSVPVVMAGGFFIFVIVALSTMMVTGGFLQYPASYAGALIMLIEAAATITIAIVLTVLFIGRDPGQTLIDKGEPHHTLDTEKEDGYR